MKSLVLYGPGQYGVEYNWKQPDIPDGWVLIRVAYAGICGSDLPRFSTTGSYHHPMILGHEFSGTVEIPTQNSKFTKGDPVAILPIIPCGRCEGCAKNEPFHCQHYQFIGSRNDGGFAEFCAVPENNLFGLGSPDDLKQGALLEPVAVGLHAVRRSNFMPGKSAVVFGAGPIGLIIALWLKAFGSNRVVIADIRQKNLDLAQQMGLADTVNLKINDIADFGSFDYAFEAAGSAVALLDAIRCLKDGGSLTIIGRDSKDTAIPLQSFEMLMRKEINLHGCWGYNMNGEWELVSDILSRKQFPLELLVTHEITIDQSADFVRAMCEKSIEYGKVLIYFKQD